MLQQTHIQTGNGSCASKLPRLTWLNIARVTVMKTTGVFSRKHSIAWEFSGPSVLCTISIQHTQCAESKSAMDLPHFCQEMKRQFHNLVTN